MAGPRYSRQHLFSLRNHIPIDRVIAAMLIPSKIQEGHYRFQCPVCTEFNTGINPKTNLARCFSCRKNYNPIDLVMVVKSLNFIDSVAYLEELPTAISVFTKSSPPTGSASNSSKDVLKPNRPVAIGDIFKSLATPGPVTPSRSQQDDTQTVVELQQRVTALEDLVKSLTEKIALIEPQ